MLINVIETCFILIEYFGQLFEIFLRHQWLKLWQLLRLNQVVQVHANRFLVKAKKVLIEVFRSVLRAPRRGIEERPVKEFFCFFSSFAEV